MKTVTGPNDRQPKFKRGYETARVVEILSSLEPGELLTYKELSGIATFPVSGASYCLQSAKKILLKEYSIAIAVVHSVGVQRMTNTDVVMASTSGTHAVCRHAVRESEKLMVADFEVLNPGEKKRFIANQAVFGAVMAVASSDGVARIEARVHADAPRLDLKATLDMFKD